MKNIENDFLQKIVCNSGYGIWQVFSYKNNICNALTKSIEKNMGWQQLYKPRTTVPQWSLVLSKPQTFKLGQRIWEDKFWGIWGIFGRFISTQFFTVSSLSMFFLNQVLFLQKKLALYIQIPNIHMGLGFEFELHRSRDLAIVCP